MKNYLLLAFFASPFVFANPVIGQDGEESGDDSEKPEWSVDNPPGDWRSVNINTDEVTWTNLDVSPDGERIVFDFLGDIWTVDIDGGDARQISSGISWDFQPKYSPDGNHIAFISDREGGDNIWVMDADGSDPHSISSEKANLLHNPAWTPDGDWIVARKGYVSGRSIPAGSLWMYHVSGGSGLMVVDRLHGEDSQKNIAEPAFSPDGQYLYYSQDITGGSVWQYNKDATGSLFAIKRLNRENGKTETFVSGPGGAIRPTPSSDGKHLAFVRRLPTMKSALYIQDLESGNTRQLFTEMDRDNQETAGTHGNTPAFAWTPDNESLVFWAGGKIHRIDVTSREVTEIPVSMETELQVRETVRFPVDVWSDEVELRALRWLQQSPTDERQVFQTLGHLYTRTGNGDPKRLTRGEDHFEFWPTFSADGKQIVYTTWNDDELGSVRIVSARGGKSRVITDSRGHYIEPRFSADGEHVVYRKFSPSALLSPKWSIEPGIYIAAVDGDDPVRVSESGFAPQFSANGERVFFSDTDEKGAMLLKSVDLNGEDEREHAKGSYVTGFHLSPNGRWLAFNEHYDTYITPFALTGQSISVSKDSDAYPVARVSQRSGSNLHWSADSQTLHWSHGAKLYSRDINASFEHLADDPESLPEPETEGSAVAFTIPADKPDGWVAITGGRVVTMRDADKFEEVIQNGTVLIEDNRIVAVGQSDDVEIPDAAYVIDASGMTVMPGLIDVHAHGGMADNQVTPQQNYQQLSNLSFGVTTIHDPSNDSAEIFSFAEMQAAGRVLGPRTFSTGTILYGALFPGFTSIIDSYEDAEFHVRRLKELGAISVKSYNQLRRDSRQQVIEAASQMGIMVVPEGGMKYQHNMTHIVDGHTGIEHSIPIQTAYDDAIQLWSATGTGYTPTFGVAYGGLTGETYWYAKTNVWENERLASFVPRRVLLPASMRRTTAPDAHWHHIKVAEMAKVLRDAGVPVMIGAHGQREGLAAHWEIWSMEQGGFTPWESLRGATIDGAWYLGLDGDIGSIETGKLADILVIDGNPIEDIRESENVKYTILNGRVYEAATMNEVGTGDRVRKPLYFELEDGDSY